MHPSAQEEKNCRLLNHCLHCTTWHVTFEKATPRHYVGRIEWSDACRDASPIQVDLKTESLGEWTLFEKADPVRVVRMGSRVRFQSINKSTTELSGVEMTDGVMKGVVFRYGKLEGEFELCQEADHKVITEADHEIVTEPEAEPQQDMETQQSFEEHTPGSFLDLLQPVPDDDVSMEDCALATDTNDVEKTKQQLPLPRPRLPPRHGSVPQALVATTEQKACPKGHVLVQFRDSNYYSYGVTCDRCCRQAIKSPEHVWRCETCN